MFLVAPTNQLSNQIIPIFKELYEQRKYIDTNGQFYQSLMNAPKSVNKGFTSLIGI